MYKFTFTEAWTELDKLNTLQEGKVLSSDNPRRLDTFRGFTTDGEYITDNDMPTLLNYACGVIKLGRDKDIGSAVVYTDLDDPKLGSAAADRFELLLVINPEKIPAVFTSSEQRKALTNCTELFSSRSVSGQENLIGGFITDSETGQIKFKPSDNDTDMYKPEIDMINNLMLHKLFTISGQAVVRTCKKGYSVKDFFTKSSLHSASHSSELFVEPVEVGDKAVAKFTDTYNDFDIGTNCQADGITLNFEHIQELNSSNNALSNKYKNPANKNKLTVFDLSPKVHLLVNWKCRNCETVYPQRVSDHTAQSRCPECTKRSQESKSERIIATAINKLINSEYKDQGVILSQGDSVNRTLLGINSNSGRKLGTDIVLLKDNKVIAALEYDGSPWHSTQNAVNNDEFKDSTLIAKNIKLMRVREISSPQEELKKLNSFNLQKAAIAYAPADSEYLKLYTVAGRNGQPIAETDANAIAKEFLDWTILKANSNAE